MRFVIVRHGDPDYSVDSLTPKGWREAELLSERLTKLDGSAEILKWAREFEGKVKINGETKSAWDRLPAEWTDNPDFYTPQGWIKTPIMQSGNVEKKYNKVCKGVDELLAKHGYVHKGNVFEVKKPNHDTIVLFCHFGVECVILSHVFGCSPMVLWHNFVALPTSVTTLITEEREEGIAVFRTQQFGDISHLYAGGEEPAFAARFCECFTDDTRH